MALNFDQLIQNLSEKLKGSELFQKLTKREPSKDSKKDVDDKEVDSSLSYFQQQDNKDEDLGKKYGEASLDQRLKAVYVDLMVIGVFSVSILIEPTFGLVLVMLLSTAYSTIMISLYGGTIGQQRQNLLVVNLESGRYLSIEESLRRNFIALVGFLLGAVGFLRPFLKPGAKTWHDQYGNSVVLFRLKQEGKVGEAQAQDIFVDELLYLGVDRPDIGQPPEGKGTVSSSVFKASRVSKGNSQALITAVFCFLLFLLVVVTSMFDLDEIGKIEGMEGVGVTITLIKRTFAEYVTKPVMELITGEPYSIEPEPQVAKPVRKKPKRRRAKPTASKKATPKDRRKKGLRTTKGSATTISGSEETIKTAPPAKAAGIKKATEPKQPPRRRRRRRSKAVVTKGKQTEPKGKQEQVVKQEKRVVRRKKRVSKKEKPVLEEGKKLVEKGTQLVSKQIKKKERVSKTKTPLRRTDEPLDSRYYEVFNLIKKRKFRDARNLLFVSVPLSTPKDCRIFNEIGKQFYKYGQVRVTRFLLKKVILSGKCGDQSKVAKYRWVKRYKFNMVLNK